MPGYQCETCRARQPYVGESGPETISADEINKLRAERGAPPIDSLTVHSADETQQIITGQRPPKPRGKRSK